MSSPVRARRLAANTLALSLLLIASCTDALGPTKRRVIGQDSSAAKLAIPVLGTPVAVVVTIDSTTIAPTHRTQARAQALDIQGTVLTPRIATWSSSNPALATVSTTGLVTALAVGAVTIRATVD